MKSLVGIALIWCVLAAEAVATPQVNDKIVIGSNTYGIYQLPMASYWHTEDEEAKGRVPLPAFEVTSSANWRGYTAKWMIADGELSLIRLRGKIDGKKVADEEIIKKRFPIVARWFTGKIFVAIGDFDAERNMHSYVLQFDIDRGRVVSTEFHESAAIPMTLDGLPAKE